MLGQVLADEQVSGAPTVCQTFAFWGYNLLISFYIYFKFQACNCSTSELLLSLHVAVCTFILALKWRPIIISRSLKGHFPLSGIFCAERHFLLFKDQLAESGRQKTKENITPRGKFLQVENGPNVPNVHRHTMHRLKGLCI